MMFFTLIAFYLCLKLDHFGSKIYQQGYKGNLYDIMKSISKGIMYK